MAAARVIEPSNSPWAAPTVLVKKKDNSWCFCVDYRRLNVVTRKDSYPLPRIDDTLDYISGSKCNFEGALRHLWEVFAAIRQAGLRLNLKKCQLFRRETAFLGHVVSAGGVATDPAKITAVHNWPPPTNVSDLRSFLGLASYYRRYVRNFATIARPIHHLTDRGQPYVWDDPCAQAFNALRTALIMAPLLAYPDANPPFILDTDASNVGVGTILSQPSDSGEQSLSPRTKGVSPKLRSRWRGPGEVLQWLSEVV
ncbi:hypothetical protein AAFF_G00378620 [Aldrovandia affinis]|uniref:Reverse transcriptase/retrotransposon-derived protein RNase H-like domain-containing protein n=1 Tax=Aldrovandia affinis TaxID=143900 RepID=A0AAD7SFK6_9TELE|nr:hypothetical protein AAFF_G00378620 [Aldrovandia affinis]